MLPSTGCRAQWTIIELLSIDVKKTHHIFIAFLSIFYVLFHVSLSNHHHIVNMSACHWPTAGLLSSFLARQHRIVSINASVWLNLSTNNVTCYSMYTCIGWQFLETLNQIPRCAAIVLWSLRHLLWIIMEYNIQRIITIETSTHCFVHKFNSLLPWICLFVCVFLLASFACDRKKWRKCLNRTTRKWWLNLGIIQFKARPCL